MESFGIGIAGLGAAGIATYGAFGLAFRQHRRRREKKTEARIQRPRSTADRLEALAAAQADLALRLDTLTTQGGAPEERLQAMAGQLLGLVRDKNATLETALAGLDQLRARMRALEQMGEPAEARALLETLQGRIDEVQAAQAAGTAALEARLAALAAPGAGDASDLADRLVKLQESRDQGAEKVLARLGPIETRLGALETGRETLKRLESRIEALQAEHGAARTEIAGLKAEAGAPVKALTEQLARLHAQKEALASQLLARITALETEMRGRDPQPALDRLAERLETLRAADAALGDRLGALENPAETPFAAIAEQLTRLYAQKDAGIEAVLTRLAPLEARLADLERGLSERDPKALLDRFAERLEAMQGRVAVLEEDGAAPFAEISAQLTSLYAQKDATVETVFARLAPLEARLAELQARDPQAALASLEARLDGLRERLGTLEEGDENPFAEISAQLTSLYAQKDATVETVFARLAPLEARLAEHAGGLARLAPLAEDDPRPAIEGLRARLETLHRAQGEVAAGLAALQAAGAEGSGLAGVADQLTRLFAQKDASVAAFLERLRPLEDRLVELEARPWDPDADEARAQAQAIAAQLIAARAAAEHTQLFADRLALLEAGLPRLNATQAQMMQAPGRRPGAVPDGLEAVWTLPRVVSLHHK